MLLKMAARNIWRNPRRTVITVLAITLGVTAIVSLHSYREAAYAEMIHSLTRGLVGHAQVHGRGYQEAPEVTLVVPDPDGVARRLTAALPGLTVERRVLGAGLAGAGDASAAALVLGVEPTHESVRALLTIQQGRALSATPRREIVLGTALARELGVAAGGEVVLVGQAADGSLANDRFTVVGLADAGSADANATTAVLHLADAQSFFALGRAVHQVILRLPPEKEDLSRAMKVLRGALDQRGLELLAWTEILPEWKNTMDQKSRQQHVLDLVVFLIVALGVLNTMTMSTFERTRELGVMAALGTRRRRILGLIVTEAVLQGAIGFAAGLAIAAGVLLGIGPLDLSQMAQGDVMGLRLPNRIELRLHGVAVVSAAATTLVTAVVGGLFPAMRAARLSPVEATRYV